VSRAITPSFTLLHPLTPSHTLSHPLTPSHTLSHPLTPSHTLSHPLTPSHTLSHRLTPSHTVSHPLAPSRTLSHPLAHPEASQASRFNLCQPFSDIVDPADPSSQPMDHTPPPPRRPTIHQRLVLPAPVPPHTHTLFAGRPAPPCARARRGVVERTRTGGERDGRGGGEVCHG
jgi:hypothetical protein